MSIMLRISIVLSGIVALMLLIPSVGRACTCELPFSNKTLKQQVLEARTKSEAVFSGKVVEIIENPQVFHVIVKFKVQGSWKQINTDEVRVFTGRGNGDCGYRFEVGESYLVYSYKYNESDLGTNICQRTMKLANAAEDLKVLGKGRQIAAIVSPFKASSCSSQSVAKSSDERQQ
jgi:hypothetical protein